MRALIALDATSIEARPRIISTVLETPTAAIRAGRLREVLRLRLGVFTMTVLPLRERRDDLLVLVDDVVRQACLKRRRSSKGLAQPSPKAAPLPGKPHCNESWSSPTASLQTRLLAAQMASSSQGTGAAVLSAMQMAAVPPTFVSSRENDVIRQVIAAG